MMCSRAHMQPRLRAADIPYIVVVAPFELLISTEKKGGIVFLKIDEVNKDAPING